ncbi:MAG: C4-type zinc ribbon domain-containing protein [Marinifilaceae bacterium]|jgi:predicted  nucleic acid-binding Zn-ribbon protein|nr:C4-type zinc ribbon domain-containing protein [Marinifilaceae bacterium]
MATQDPKASDLKDMTVEDKLRALYEMQMVDSETDQIRILRGELPLEVQDLEDEIAGLQTRISNLNSEVKELVDSIAKKKIEIKESTALIKKYETQQSNVRNNREFDSISKEIEFQKLEIELCEKRIREFTSEMNGKKVMIDNSGKVFADKKDNLDSKKQELDSIVAETKKEEEKLVANSDQIKDRIEERLLTAYTRIRSNARNGLAVVTVQRDACGGCFNKIPPQRQMDIRSRKKVIVCEYCGRILVDKYICDYDHSMEEADKAAEAAKPKRRTRKKSV